MAGIVALLVGAGCAGAGSRGAPVDAGELARSLTRATRPAAPLRIVFEWRYRDREARFTGEGLARLAPPYRGRLDLFSGRGETVLRAGVMGGELRLPPGAAAEVGLPPPALLWAALGVYRPGADASLGGAWSGDEGSELLLRLPGEGEELAYGVGERRLRWAELRNGGHAVERVELEEYGERGLPREARYRNLRAFRELVIEITDVERVESFSSEIWRPAR